MIPHLSERALILAPHGRDAKIAASILDEVQVRSHICTSLSDLLAGLKYGAGFALLTEEGMRTADLVPLTGWIEEQPKWSDFPFILLTQRGGGGIERNPAAVRLLKLLGNVNFLERPFHPTTLVSLAESALRGRRRQYEARSRLEELDRSAAKYRSLFESIDAGFCLIEMVFDEAGKPIDYIFLEANPAFERQTGLTNVVGSSMRTLVPEHEQTWMDVYGRVARTGARLRFEEHADALGGRWYDVYAFRAGNPEDMQVAILFNDISDRRRMELSLRESEESMRRLNETLEERVVERTRELEHAQDALRQSQKLESLGQLTGGVAHDFNNLLMGISTSLSLLQKRVPSDPNLHHLIENAMQGVDRGASLTQRMLAFARQQTLTTELIDLTKLVRGMTELMERTLGPAWTLELQFPETLPLVLADANQLEMSLLNLAVNARDAMPEGGVIRIVAEQVSGAEIGFDRVSPGFYVGLSVIDTGHGMDAVTLERATEPFFTTKDIGKGTGLGLPMIHGFARQLGGTFVLKSAVGKGTSATLWLPAADRASIGSPPPVHAPEPSPPVARLKVLAVDDDGLILMNVCALLEDLGHEVLEASSGSQALKLIEEDPDIDLVITDQAMPNMTGSQLIQQMRDRRLELPVILASGYGELPLELVSGVVRLSKPYGTVQLEQAMQQALERYATAKPA